MEKHIEAIKNKFEGALKTLKENHETAKEEKETERKFETEKDAITIKVNRGKEDYLTCRKNADEKTLTFFGDADIKVGDNLVDSSETHYIIKSVDKNVMIQYNGKNRVTVKTTYEIQDLKNDPFSLEFLYGHMKIQSSGNQTINVEATAGSNITLGAITSSPSFDFAIFPPQQLWEATKYDIKTKYESRKYSDCLAMVDGAVNGRGTINVSKAKKIAELLGTFVGTALITVVDHYIGTSQKQ
jgi:hypothetical protein